MARTNLEWRLLCDHPDYEISEFGDLRRVTADRKFHVGMLLKPALYRGYLKYSLRLNGVRRVVAAHRLVATAFIGPSPFDGAEVCHKDGVRTNNHYSNLRWDTRVGNCKDKIAHGTLLNGERLPQSKLTEALVVEARRRVGSGESQRSVARSLNVSHTTIGNAINGACWGHVA